MRRITREECPQETLQRMLTGVTFFKELIQEDPTQFEMMMSITQFGIADQGDIILRKGDPADVLYFLLRGDLEVLPEESGEPIGTISAGEILGVMAMILNDRRSASLRVAGRNAILAGIHYDYFSKPEHASLFSLRTKLNFFRMLNANIRWNIEKNRIAHPSHPLVARLRTIPLFSGPRDTEEELIALKEQSLVLSELLCDWNTSSPAEA